MKKIENLCGEREKRFHVSRSHIYRLCCFFSLVAAASFVVLDGREKNLEMLIIEKENRAEAVPTRVRGRRERQQNNTKQKKFQDNL